MTWLKSFNCRCLYRWLPVGTIMMASLLTACGGGEESDGLDPVVEDYPIAYVKRPIPLDEEGALVETDIRDVIAFNVGADLYLRQRASSTANETNITNSVTQGLGDIKDVSASFDGTKLLFALRLPEIEDADEEDQPTWNIWEYDIPTKELRRVIESNITAELGQDVSPSYLTNGRIVFASTRQRQSQRLLLDEGKPQFPALNEDRNDVAMMLHVMDPDGSDIEQISFNQSMDFDPVVLSSGEIVFSRWDNSANRNGVSLYKMNPDGTGLEMLYGIHSHDGEEAGENNIYQFSSPKEMLDGRLVAIVSEFDRQLIDKLVYIDVENFADDGQLIDGGFGDEPLQEITGYNITVDDAISPGGHISSISPLWDNTNRALLSWSSCRVIEDERAIPCNDENLVQEDVVEAPLKFGIYIYDLDKQTQLPIVLPQDDIVFTDLVAARPRDFIFNTGETLDSDMVGESVGVLHIRSVYDLDGQEDFDSNGAVDNPDVSVMLGGATVDSIADLSDPANVSASSRPARFLRVVKGVSIPDDDIKEIANSDYGRSRNQLMREIVGYSMIEPDGSVMMKVPADVPLMISILDEDGRRISDRHNSWIHVRPGEVLECNGCHDHDSGLPHGRSGGIAALNSGAPTSGLPFPNTNPLWDAEMGETMAQTRVRNECGSSRGQFDCSMLTPSVDLVFEDVWPDEDVAAKEDPFSYQYADLGTAQPPSDACSPWSTMCRIVINYPDHIHPLWSLSRPVFDTDGTTLLRDDACTGCHTISDGVIDIVPDGQLDLSDDVDDGLTDIRRKAYDELFNRDNEQELVDGVLVDRLIDVERQAQDEDGNLLFETDEDGNLVLDGDDNPIPVMEIIQVTVGVAQSMSTNSARANYFLEKMTGEELRAGRSLSNDPNTVDHTAMLSSAELKLISEWLDVGGQYYNNPFDIPDPED